MAGWAGGTVGPRLALQQLLCSWECSPGWVDPLGMAGRGIHAAGKGPEQHCKPCSSTGLTEAHPLLKGHPRATATQPWCTLTLSWTVPGAAALRGCRVVQSHPDPAPQL